MGLSKTERKAFKGSLKKAGTAHISTLSQLISTRELLLAMDILPKSSLSTTRDNYPIYPLYDIVNQISIPLPELSTEIMAEPILQWIKHCITIEKDQIVIDILKKAEKVFKELTCYIKSNQYTEGDCVYPIAEIVNALQIHSPELTKDMIQTLMPVFDKCITRTEITISNYSKLKL